MHPTIVLAQALIQKNSFTPDDAGCQKLIAEHLAAHDFSIQHERFGQVDNVLFYHGNQSPGLLFLGHTDVVPTGDRNHWKYPPLGAEIHEGVLYGRGAADMKGSVAAMAVAMQQFVSENPNHKGKLGLMLTSDEEGVAVDGVRKMMPLVAQQHDFNYCLVGEPSSAEKLADTVRSGRRGSLHVNIKIHGKQGHVAYPHLAENPMFSAAQAIAEMGQKIWDTGNEDFPATSFQISNVSAGTGVSNIIPGELLLQANFRYSPESSQQSLKRQLIELLDKHSLKYTLEWQLSGEPFFCNDPGFREIVAQSIYQEVGIKPEFNTGGGTSDGRFVAPHGIATLELGPINKTIHQVDECESVENLILLTAIYQRIIESILL